MKDRGSAPSILLVQVVFPIFVNRVVPFFLLVDLVPSSAESLKSQWVFAIKPHSQGLFSTLPVVVNVD